MIIYCKVADEDSYIFLKNKRKLIQDRKHEKSVMSIFCNHIDIPIDQSTTTLHSDVPKQVV